VSEELVIPSDIGGSEIQKTVKSMESRWLIALGFLLVIFSTLYGKGAFDLKSTSSKITLIGLGILAYFLFLQKKTPKPMMLDRAIEIGRRWVIWFQRQPNTSLPPGAISTTVRHKLRTVNGVPLRYELCFSIIGKRVFDFLIQVDRLDGNCVYSGPKPASWHPDDSPDLQFIAIPSEMMKEGTGENR